MAKDFYKRFGGRRGTKVYQAVAMFARGARMQDVKKKLGSNFFNVLRRLEGEGHKVVKGKGGLITVRPKR